MTRVQQTVEVNTPVRVVYNQLTQFEEYPRFMEDVDEVRQIDDTHLHWRCKLGGKEMEWDAEITEQVPDQIIAWRNTSGQKNEGRVVVRPVADNKTQVTLTMDIDVPQQAAGGAGGKREAESALTRRTEQDLARFKQFIESRGQETGEWRGEIRQGHVVTPDQFQRNQQGDTTMATRTGQTGTERQEGTQAGAQTGQQVEQQGGMAGQQGGMQPGQQGMQPGEAGASTDVGFSAGQQGGQQGGISGQYQISGMGGQGQMAQRGQQGQGRPVARVSGQAWLPNFFQAWEEPFAMMRRMTQEMDHMFERFMGRPMSVSNRWMSTAGASQWLPSVDVSQRNNELVVCADLPGIRKEDVSVEIRNDQLTIEGERREESEQSVQGYHRSERSYGHFYRMIPLPEGVDAEHAQATMHDGVLEIKVPLPQSTRYGRRLDIQETQSILSQHRPGQQQQYSQQGSQQGGMQAGVSGQFQVGSEEQGRAGMGGQYQSQGAGESYQQTQSRGQQQSGARVQGSSSSQQQPGDRKSVV